MIRKKDLVLVSHCVPNQNIGIIQLPCPEIKHLGCNRPPMTKEEYTTTAYIDLCSRLATDQLNTLLEYKNIDYSILGLIGIGNSPTCDTLVKKGVFMEIFLTLCADHGINLKPIDINEDYIEGESNFNFEL